MVLYPEVMNLKINRLFEIVYILLEKKVITAKKLSEHFEVSMRTIYRDIDTLSAAGIPIFTNKDRGVSSQVKPATFRHKPYNILVR